MEKKGLVGENMDKFQLLNKLKENLEKRGHKIEITLNKPKANPLLEVINNQNKIYIAICEAGIKIAKYPKIVFCGISPKIQSLIEIRKTYVIVIDHKPSKLKYVLAKLDSTNYRKNKIGYLIFDFKRPDCGNFYNTDSLEELCNEIQKENISYNIKI